MTESFKAVVLEEADGKVSASIKTLDDDALPDGDVTVQIEYSDLNYKDGMILGGLGRIVRQYPHIPGVDFSGTVAASAHPDFKPGDKVVLTGWRVGEVWWGGYAQRARVKGDWLLPIPAGLDARRAMAVGTAGLTAALAIIALEEHGLSPDVEGELLVTGAAGGVGSTAVALAARRGYRVAASTGRASTHDYLRSLGATTIVDRAELSDGPTRPLDKERWCACVDSVGSKTLATVLSQMRYRGAVAACGLAAGPDLPASIIPFLLRGVSLLGVDSVMCNNDRRRAAWQMISDNLPVDVLDAVTEVVPLERVIPLGRDILAGQVRGRVVVDVNA